MGDARGNFLVPVPYVTTWEELNAQLLAECMRRCQRKLWGHTQTILNKTMSVVFGVTEATRECRNGRMLNCA